MKTRLSIFLLFTLLPIFSFGEEIYPNIKDIRYEDTPLYDFFVDYERFFITTFPYFFFEIKMDELDENSKKLFYKSFTNQHFFCKNSNEGNLLNIHEFCLFFNKVFDNDYKNLEELEFKDSLLSDLKYVFLAIQYGKKGLFEQLEKNLEQVKDLSLRIFYKDLIRVVNNSEIKDSKLNYLSCIYQYYRSENICIIDSNEDYEGILSFFKARNYFNERDYIKSAQLFMLSHNNLRLRDVSLENAIYSLFHAGEYNKALEIAKDANPIVKNKVGFLISFIKGDKLPLDNGFFSEKGFDTFILSMLKEKISKGINLNFLKDFKFESDSEEVNFYMCLVSIINKKNIDECLKKRWNKNLYSSLIDLVSGWYKKIFNYDNLENKKEIEVFLEESGLKHYYPFNFLLAEIAFENNNFDKAQKIYEYFIRYPKYITVKELSEAYYKLGVIFKNKKSYYTALKLLEKNLFESFNGIRDKSRVEYVKILMLKEKCDEVLIYVPIFIKDMKNDYLKNEMNETLNFCEAEKNKTVMGQEVNK